MPWPFPRRSTAAGTCGHRWAVGVAGSIEVTWRQHPGRTPAACIVHGARRSDRTGTMLRSWRQRRNPEERVPVDADCMRWPAGRIAASARVAQCGESPPPGIVAWHGGGRRPRSIGQRHGDVRLPVYRPGPVALVAVATVPAACGIHGSVGDCEAVIASSSLAGVWSMDRAGMRHAETPGEIAGGPGRGATPAAPAQANVRLVG